ncbi:MAG: SIR2 family protein [Acidobacteriaceae bacterium]
MADDQYYLGNSPFPLGTRDDDAKLIQRLRQYLELRNLTVLLGNGCSLPLGSPRVASFLTIRPDLSLGEYRLGSESDQNEALRILDLLVPNGSDLGLEAVLAILANIRANEELIGKPAFVDTKPVSAAGAECLERLLKKWLYLKCRALNGADDISLRAHEELLRRILMRSTTLPRAKVFTVNYDLVIERALDNLGVHYFDGFSGTINRTLRTESYHYDLYFPGETTEGRVSRVDRVLHLYKLHGSINWRRRRGSTLDVIIRQDSPDDREVGDVMIYPSPLKVAEMNGYPYSEMFRHFSAQIHQPQSALLVIGYRFQDSHINRLIYQALGIPSFVLIIVTPQVAAPEDGKAPDERHEVWRLTQINSKRIVVITGGEKDGSGEYVSGAGTLQEFSVRWMPDISELNVEAKARDEMAKAFPSPILDRRQNDAK